MKQKRTFVTLLLVIALLCLGIGYAAITGFDLTITGNLAVTTDSNNFDVEFINSGENVIVVAKSEGVPASATATAVIDASDANSRTVKVDVAGLTTAGQTVTVTCPIQNTSTDNLAAELSNVVAKVNKKGAETDSTYFSVSEPQLVDTRLEKGDVTTITFTITLNKTPITAEDIAEAESTVTVTFNAQPDQPTQQAGE